MRGEWKNTEELSFTSLKTQDGVGEAAVLAGSRGLWKVTLLFLLAVENNTGQKSLKGLVSLPVGGHGGRHSSKCSSSCGHKSVRQLVTQHPQPGCREECQH